MRRLAWVALAGALAVSVAGCESSQSKSARLAKQAKTTLNAKGLTVTRQNPDVKVDDGIVLHDKYGSAAIVEVRNLSSTAQVALPIAIAVTDKTGRTAFKNDAAGLEKGLTHLDYLPPKAHVAWVNNQVKVDDPKSVEAKVGPSSGKAPAKVPELVVADVRYETDPDGIVVKGTVTNRSAILQRNVTVFIVARKGGKIVAAGRAGIEKIKPGKPAKFTSFFTGDPKGAKLEIFAPPSVLG
jgi:hypothetical protein